MHHRGFTLIELVLVVAIMATLAGSVVMLGEGVHADVDRQLAEAEMSRVREAILRFHADTGFLPGEGPFDLEPQGRVLLTRVQAEAGTSDSSLAARWFSSAVNVWQLLESPLSGHPLATWDPDRRRGWNGPYLSQGTNGLVQVGYLDGRSGWSGSAAVDPAGDLLSADVLPPSPAVADPHSFSNAPPGAPAAPFKWISALQPELHLARQGRPYLLLLPHQGGRVVREAARIVSTGADGALDPLGSTDGDDLTLYLFR